MLSRRRWHLPSLNIYSMAHNNFPIIDYFWHFSRLAFTSCLHFPIEIKMRCKQKVNMIFQVPLIHRGWNIRKIRFAKKCIFCKKKESKLKSFDSVDCKSYQNIKLCAATKRFISLNKRWKWKKLGTRFFRYERR